MKNNRNHTTRFVKVYPGLSYLLSRDEIYVLMHLMDIEYLRENNHSCLWGKEEYMRRMKMPRYTFDKCVHRLLELGIITRSTNNYGNRVDYGINFPVYNKLVDIFSGTYNYRALEEFFYELIEKQKRAIISITPEEINALKKCNKYIRKSST